MIWSRNRLFFLRISIIFCMRKFVIISNGFRILPCPPGLQNDLKTKIFFFYFFQKIIFIFFASPWGYCFLVPPWGHDVAADVHHRFAAVACSGMHGKFPFCVASDMMASPWGFSRPRAPKELFNFFSKKWFGSEASVFLTDFHHILHAQNCDHLQWFPHTPMPPGLSKWPKN